MFPYQLTNRSAYYKLKQRKKERRGHLMQGGGYGTLAALKCKLVSDRRKLWSYRVSSFAVFWKI